MLGLSIEIVFKNIKNVILRFSEKFKVNSYENVYFLILSLFNLAVLKPLFLFIVYFCSFMIKHSNN